MPKSFEEIKQGFQRVAKRPDVCVEYLSILMSGRLKTSEEKRAMIDLMMSIRSQAVFAEENGFNINTDDWKTIIDTLKKPEFLPHMPQDMSDRLNDLALHMVEKAAAEGNDNYRDQLIKKSRLFSGAAKEFAALIPAGLDMNLKETITTPDVEIKKREPIRLKISGPNAPDQPGAP